METASSPAAAGRTRTLRSLTGVVHSLRAPLATSVGSLDVVEGDRSTDGSLVTDGVYEPQETAILEALLAPGMQVLDVGANIGYFSLLAARKVGPTGVVHALEPEPMNLRILHDNVLANSMGNVALWACALSDREGTSPLFVSRSNLGRHSFAFSNVPRAGATVDVRTRTLDNFCSDMVEAHVPTLVKVDVEGAEGKVLRGGSTVLSSESVTVWFELWPEGMRNSGTDPEELMRWLDGFGFHAAVYDDVRLTPVRLESVSRGLRESWSSVRYLLLERSADRIVSAAEAASLIDPLHRES